MDTDSGPLSIVYVTQYFPPETGAAATRADELTKRWAESGHDVTVLTSAPDYPEGTLYEGYENEWLRREERDDVTVYLTKTIPASTDGFFRRAVKFLWFMFVSLVIGLRATSPDVVVATSPQPFTGISGWFIARTCRAKFVFELRDLWPQTIEEMSDFDNRWLLTGLHAVIDFLYKRADKVAVVSKGFEPTLRESGLNTKDIWFHPNGVEPSFFDHPEDVWEVEQSTREAFGNRFIVSHIGTMGRTHGLKVVIETAERFQKEPDYDDVLFALVGYGAKKQELKRMVDQRGLDNVLFVDRRPWSEIPDFLHHTDVSLVHVKNEELTRASMPFKMFEAMASGTPIALGVYGESERIIEEANAGSVFEPENSVQFTDAIKTLYDDAGLREELGENGASYVREHFSWDSIAEDYRQNLESLVRERDH